ncbi:MAG: 50S ribosomal protein L16 [Candidatus Pacebacteria bacterium]|nr:50S ribosomal protein L16 [Candidatus Paceibacterota bacterium]
MLFPKKVKHRKWHRLRKNPKKKQVATRGTTVAFGSFGLRSEQVGEISSNQIESVRKVLTRAVQKSGKLWIRIFPDKPITQKPPEVTMGSGKGDPKGYVAEIKPGRVLFEIDGLPEKEARNVLRKAASKLPIKAKCVARE